MSDVAAAWKAIRGTEKEKEYKQKADTPGSAQSNCGNEGHQRKALMAMLHRKLMKVVRFFSIINGDRT
jgi:hypothetical protein